MNKEIGSEEVSRSARWRQQVKELVDDETEKRGRMYIKILRLGSS